MNSIDFLMSIGTLLSLISTFPQFRAVLENRDNLKGYSPFGAALLALAMTSFGTAFVIMGNWFSFLCNVPIAVFWGTTAFYSYKSRKGGSNSLGEE